MSDDSRLSINGGQGQAGSLSLTAQNGSVYAYNDTGPVDFGVVIDAGASGSGASFNLDTGGAFNLPTFAEGVGKAFSGDISIRTGTGDLQLISGDGLKAADVQLVADGGVVDSAGTIDVSGVNGGAVTLFGAQGVILRSGSLIDAHADGYGATDSRQASGGDVTLGVEGAGTIEVDQGAVIDVAALNTANRLIPMDRGDGVFYTFVPGDQGGSVTFRAPVIEQGAVDKVAVTVQGAVEGAASVVLEGFKQFDLGAFANANDPNSCWGVCVSGGQATLQSGATSSTGQDQAPCRIRHVRGTLDSTYVQDFRSYLGGLRRPAATSPPRPTSTPAPAWSWTILATSFWRPGWSLSAGKSTPSPALSRPAS